jgi:hypothetical protein
MGLRVGMLATEVERINGRSFEVTGFGWDYGGFATQWKGGTLSKIPGGCALIVAFQPDENAPEDKLNAVSGDQQVRSNSQEFRATKPKIKDFLLRY